MSRSHIAALVLGLFAAAIVIVLAAGEMLSRPARSRIGAVPAGLDVHGVTLATPSAGAVSGWFIPGKPGGGAVLLLHGVRSNRNQMVARARFLHAAGYATLLIDLPAHGESGGDRITFGVREAQGVRAALDYLRQTALGERIGVIGVSLGGASLVFADVLPAPSAVVLESMYPTIAEAVTDRLVMRFGASGQAIAPLLLWQLPIRLGVSADELKPIDGIGKLRAPVLIASGMLDQQTTIAETRRLFAAAAEPKALWEVEGAAHVDLHAFDPRAYEKHILSFLGKHLQAR